MIRLVLFLVLLVFPAQSGWAQIACGTATTSVTEADPQTLVFTPDAGSDRIVIVAVSLRDSVNPTNAVSTVSSTGGGTWTIYAQEDNGGTPPARSAIIYSTDFTDGSQTLSVDYSLSSPSQGTIGAFTCTGVNTASPWRAARTTASGSATSGSMNVSSAVDDLVVDVLSLSGTTGDSLTIGASQTQKVNLSNGGVNLFTGASTEAGGATVAMSWSWVNSRPWVSVGGSLQPAIDDASGAVRRR